MGLFDYIRCEYPLPGTPPPFASQADFQTKDLPCSMTRYTITAAGRLVDDGGTEDYSDLTGTINFYDSNVVASGPGIYTRNGEDAVYLEYEATFVSGKLAEIKEIENRTERAMKSKPRGYPRLSPEESQAIADRHAESLIGRTMCVWWGGDRDGYMVTVIAENRRNWLVQGVDEEAAFEKISRGARDSTFFDSYEDGKRDKEERAARWAAEKQEYEAVISSPREREPTA